jgi:hypothetical protein
MVEKIVNSINKDIGSDQAFEIVRNSLDGITYMEEATNAAKRVFFEYIKSQDKIQTYNGHRQQQYRDIGRSILGGR